MRKLIYATVGAVALVAGSALHYALPRVSTVQIVGVEVKRVDGESGSRDVYMIQAQELNDGPVRVFRNEDALLYLKVNSADLQAKAAALSRGDPPRTVEIRHYGWRIPVLSVFPNALSAREVDAGRGASSLLGVTLLLTGLAALVVLVWRRRRVRARGAEGRAAEPVRSEGSAPDPAGDWMDTDRRTGSGAETGSAGSTDA